MLAKRLWIYSAGGVLLAFLAAGSVSLAYRPLKTSLDLSMRSNLPLVEGGEAAPDNRFPEVMGLRDKAGRLTVDVALDRADAYLWRIKLAFQKPGQTARVMLNGNLVAELTSTKGADQAEKFDLRIPAQWTQAGPNKLSFENSLPGSVRYEQIQAKNFRSEIAEGSAYLVFSDSAAERWGGVKQAAWVFAIGMILSVSFLWMRSILAWSCGDVWGLRLTLGVAAALFLMLIASTALPWMTPWKVILSPAASAVFCLGLPWASTVLVSLPTVVWRLIRWGIQKVSKVRLPIKASAKIVLQAAGKSFVWLLVCVLPWVAKVLWKWLLRHQNAEGYVRFFGYLLGFTAIFWMLKMPVWVNALSEWAWVALMIGVFLHVWRALSDQDEIPE